MSNITASPGTGHHIETHRVTDLRGVLLVGRILFAAIFILAAPSHFAPSTIAYASSHGVVWAQALVPLAGLIAFVGGLSVLLGFHARVGAWLLVVFLVPITLAMHNFWAVHDAQMAQIQQVMFMKNMSMIGAALMIAYFGSGPLSIDTRRPPQE
jgi:putative oxidoreductase